MGFAGVDGMFFSFLVGIFWNILDCVFMGVRWWCVLCVCLRVVGWLFMCRDFSFFGAYLERGCLPQPSPAPPATLSG